MRRQWKRAMERRVAHGYGVYESTHPRASDPLAWAEARRTALRQLLMITTTHVELSLLWDAWALRAYQGIDN